MTSSILEWFLSKSLVVWTLYIGWGSILSHRSCPWSWDWSEYWIMFLPWKCSCGSSVSISCPFPDVTMLCLVNALDHALGHEVPISFIIFIVLFVYAKYLCWHPFFSFASTHCFSYVLGAVETFLNAVPAAGIFRGKDSKFSADITCDW